MAFHRHHVLLTALLAAATAAGCATAPAPVGAPPPDATVQPMAVVPAAAKTGRLEFRLKKAADKAYGLKAAVADVRSLRIAVEGATTLVREVSTANLAGDAGTVAFEDLAPGEVIVTVEALDVEGDVVGHAEQAKSIQAGYTAVVGVDLKLFATARPNALANLDVDVILEDGDEVEMPIAGRDVDEDGFGYPRLGLVRSVLRGQVVDEDGAPVPYAHVTIEADHGGEEITLTADEDGLYSAEVQGSRMFWVSASADGHLSGEIDLNVGGAVDGQDVEHMIVLPRALAGTSYRFFLSWVGELELDTYLTGPKAEGGRFLVNYFSRTFMDGVSFAEVDNDANDGTIGELTRLTITDVAAGTYKFAVHNYEADPLSHEGVEQSGVRSLAESGAIVQIFSGDEDLGSAQVPTEGAGLVWDAVELDGATREVTFPGVLRGRLEGGAIADGTPVEEAPGEEPPID